MIAICSAFKTALVAIDINGKKDFCQIDANCGHSEKLLPAIDGLLTKNILSLVDNDSFAVVIGPGSFTGLRIALALIKGLCAGQNKDVYPITSFEFMAYTYIKHFKPQKDFVCLINALSGQVFACRFSKEGKQIGQEKLLKTHELGQELYVGLEDEDLSMNKVKLSAEELLELAQIKKAAQKPLAAENLAPLYMRKSQAEDDLEKREKKLLKS